MVVCYRRINRYSLGLRNQRIMNKDVVSEIFTGIIAIIVVIGFIVLVYEHRTYDSISDGFWAVIAFYFAAKLVGPNKMNYDTLKTFESKLEEIESVIIPQKETKE